ncbi:restriction endonuclease subunit S [Actinoallomurus liliacearum]|uniref:Restriction endonuclease subunit S n=1 Tax=Actinoallomurus liliacearum TaxID=1080073 RepID=A0ABP8TZF0_9ACTN
MNVEPISYDVLEYVDLPWQTAKPAHWRVRRIKSLFKEQSRTGFPQEPLLAATQSMGVVRKDRYATRTVTAEKGLHLLKLAKPGDFVISLRSFQGGIELCHDQGIISPAYTVLESVDPSFRDFFSIFFKSRPFIAGLTLFITGIRDGQNVNYSTLSRSYLAIPPLDEQRAIVKYVRHIEQEVGAAIRAKQRLISLLGEQKQAIRHAALTRGLNTTQNLKESGLPGVGLIPAHWEVMRAKQLCQRIVDCKNRTPDLVSDGGYTVVRTTNIRSGEFRLEGSFETDKKNYDIWTQRGAPRQGDVFFTREAPAGEACLVPELQGLCMGQRMMYLRPDPAVLDSRFLVHSIYGPAARTYIDLATNGSTVGHLRLGQVGSVPVIWCPVDEQRAIADHIDREWKPLNATITRAEREISLLREYQTRLIADVVTGKLDVRAAAAALPDVHPHDPGLIAVHEADQDGLNVDLDGDDPAEESM